MDSGPYFEDFEVGRTYTGPERTLSPADVAAFAELSGDRHPVHTRDEQPLVHGPLGIACFFGWLYETGLGAHVEAALDTRWRYLAPLHPGDRVSYEMTITRARRTSARVNGVIGRHVLVRDQRGVLVQEGETAALVTARDADGDDAQRVGRAFPGAAWARALGERLAASPAFTTQTSTWDGTIGLRFGEDVVQFRIYRGRVLDCGTRTPDGPTFVLGAPDITWVRLLTGPVNDFTKRTMRGEFTVSGSAYEYLRLTSALVALVDEARALAKEAA
jgi:acyl dehydratase/putative sterol carrier protein